MKMKKSILSILAAAATGTAAAAANDLVVSFSTPGPDKYADGRTVLDGEYYALVWSKDLSAFGIDASGAGSGGEVVLKAPVAKNGRCPAVMFEVDASLVSSRYSGGKWAVYLLDTRKFSAGEGGEIVARVGGDVNTFGLVAEAAVGGTIASVFGVAAAADSIADGKSVPAPEVTDILLDGSNVYIYAKGTVPYLSYGLKAGDDPAAVTQTVGDAQGGQINEADEIIFVAPAGEKGFFKVGQ